MRPERWIRSALAESLYVLAGASLNFGLAVSISGKSVRFRRLPRRQTLTRNDDVMVVGGRPTGGWLAYPGESSGEPRAVDWLPRLRFSLSRTSRDKSRQSPQMNTLRRSSTNGPATSQMRRQQMHLAFASPYRKRVSQFFMPAMILAPGGSTEGTGLER